MARVLTVVVRMCWKLACRLLLAWSSFLGEDKETPSSFSVLAWLLSRSKRSFWDTEADFDGRVAGFELEKLMIALMAAVAVAFTLYLLWHCSCGSSTSEDTEDPPPRRRVVVTKDDATLFFTELEPGLVLLQSQDGEIFRILHEYETARPGSGISGSGASAYIGSRGDSSSSLHYFPSCTRLQAPPSAPPSSQDLQLIDMSIALPPPYSDH